MIRVYCQRVKDKITLVILNGKSFEFVLNSKGQCTRFIYSFDKESDNVKVRIKNNDFYVSDGFLKPYRFNEDLSDLIKNLMIYLIDDLNFKVK